MRSLVVYVLLVASFVLVQGQQDRINIRTSICAPMSLAECKRAAQNCFDFQTASRSSFSDRLNAISCASEQGISFLQLLLANGAGKTNREILADAGASKDGARKIARCVLTNKGFASNNRLHVDQVKAIVRSVIPQHITKRNQKAAVLAAVDNCPAPTIYTFRQYHICLTKACIRSR